MNIPINIQNLVGNCSYVIDDIGMSNSQVVCYDDMVLKIEKQHRESDNEYNMMLWLQDKIPVPKIIYLEKSSNTNYLLMSKIKGDMLCSSKFLRNPKLLLKLLAEGLHMLWSVDITHCPIAITLEDKLSMAEVRVLSDLCDMKNAEPETYGENGFISPKHLLEWLKSNKPVEKLVFSHGDYGLPNIFGHRNRVSGFIDLGRGGVSDKHQDIALCYRSLKNNLSGRYGGKIYPAVSIDMFVSELKTDVDLGLIRYYTLLDELF